MFVQAAQRASRTLIRDAPRRPRTGDSTRSFSQGGSPGNLNLRNAVAGLSLAAFVVGVYGTTIQQIKMVRLVARIVISF